MVSRDEKTAACSRLQQRLGRLASKGAVSDAEVTARKALDQACILGQGLIEFEHQLLGQLALALLLSQFFGAEFGNGLLSKLLLQGLQLDVQLFNFRL